MRVAISFASSSHPGSSLSKNGKALTPHLQHLQSWISRAMFLLCKILRRHLRACLALPPSSHGPSRWMSSAMGSEAKSANWLLRWIESLTCQRHWADEALGILLHWRWNRFFAKYEFSMVGTIASLPRNTLVMISLRTGSESKGRLMTSMVSKPQSVFGQEWFSITPRSARSGSVAFCSSPALSQLTASIFERMLSNKASRKWNFDSWRPGAKPGVQNSRAIRLADRPSCTAKILANPCLVLLQCNSNCAVHQPGSGQHMFRLTEAERQLSKFVRSNSMLR